MLENAATMWTDAAAAPQSSGSKVRMTHSSRTTDRKSDKRTTCDFNLVFKLPVFRCDDRAVHTKTPENCRDFNVSD